MAAIFADDVFKCIFVNENVRILIKISLKFAPKDPIYNMPALVQIMAWRRPGKLVYWRLHASLGLNELTDCALEMFWDMVVIWSV